MQTSLLAATLAAALLACAAGPHPPADADAPALVVEAQPLWLEVYSGLARRADRGDAESARLALEMHRVAPWAYGTTFDATPAQLRAWRCRAAGREAPCATAAPLA